MRLAASLIGLTFASSAMAGVAVAVAARDSAGFAYGVASGEATPTSVKLWTRAPAAGTVTLTVVEATKKPTVRTFTLRAVAGNDLTVQRVVTGLAPSTEYRYTFAQRGSGGASAPGLFRTAPKAATNARVRFAISGDADATPGLDGRPGFNNFETYGQMAAEGNDFNINLGDTIYSDSEIAGVEPALTVPAKWGKYKLGLALPALRSLRASASLYSQPDDHEYINDFSVPEFGKPLYRAGVKAFTDYAPVSWKPASGYYRTFRWGKNLELFVLDERSFRSAKVAKQCGNDLAPTGPAAVRQAFSTLVPSLASPVLPGCIAAINDPSRTMLGSAQEKRFLAAIKASTATFKVIVNEVPIQQFYQLPYDRWEGYAAARTQLLKGLGGVRNVVFLTTDTHANMFGEVRLQTLEGPPIGTGIWEAVTGPVATNTYAKEIDSVIGAKGTGDFVTSLFLKPTPPAGIGMPCAATDVFSYSQVVVTGTKLTVTPKTSTGAPVREKTGAVCAPLVITAR
ncbi:MAG: alkaline phosphatase D family protein [Thermoleophilia bacterium]|nr:alkaline phosphatase D family protein [Thermoleophilia bacterium]